MFNIMTENSCLSHSPFFSVAFSFLYKGTEWQIRCIARVTCSIPFEHECNDLEKVQKSISVNAGGFKMQR